MGNYLSRYGRSAVFFAAVLIFFWLVWTLRAVIIPFALGAIAAYLIAPLVAWTEKRIPCRPRWRSARRAAVILLIYGLIAGVVGAVGYFTIPAIAAAIRDLAASLPTIISEAVKRLQDWTESIRGHVPSGMRGQLDIYIADGLHAVARAVESAITNTLLSLPSKIATVMAFLSLPVFVFYILKDADSMSANVYARLSEWSGVQVRSILRIINEVMGRYVRTQVVMSAVLGIMALVALLILRIPYAPALAIWAGIVEFIPLFGTWIGGATAVIVALATVPQHAFWVAVAFGAIRMTEDALLAPRIAGQMFRIHPALVLVLIVAAGYFAGFWGIIVALPVTATIIRLYHYVLRATRREELREGIDQAPQ